jgi:tetratricopeptide (TPR) repeat protein
MNVPPRRRLFSRREAVSPYRLAFYIFLILALLWILRGIEGGQIKPPFLPTPTPTRSAISYALEGDALFMAGKLDASIAAYQQALKVDPGDAQVWAKLARIQTYSSALLTTDPQRLRRLQEAQVSADKALELDPDDSNVHAIRAFVLDWNANPSLIGEEAAQELLAQAEQEAVRALQLDNQNTLALAFYAEILVDQQKWVQAEQYIRQAVEKDPGLMDVHRVYAYVLETLGQYNQAITEYDRAIAITPNLTFLYLRAGANYRRLAFGSPSAEQAEPLYTRSLEYFDKAARLNEQLGIQDPVPYMSIAKTYSQMGEYFIAGRNMQKAIEIDPSNADLYGQLGIIFFKSRNYEGSIPAFRCAIYGCTIEESCLARYGRECDPDFGEKGAEVQGLALSDSTVVYYYTYGSVLAALSRPRDNQCAEAMTILSQVKQAYGKDPDIAGIVRAGEQICQSLGTQTIP